jgi:hypothetical protein
VIHQERYYLIPVCAPGSTQPSDAASVRAQIAALMRRPDSPATPLVSLAGLKRAALASLRLKINTSAAQALDALRQAPILLNCDRRRRDLPLSELRQAERGVGGHALTLFDTGETIVFDQSHIFFDGAWGAALAEIMTHEALAWAVYLNSLAPVQPGDDTRPTAGGSAERPRALALQLQPSERALARNLPRVTPEAAAETDAVNINAILALRKLFKQRSDLLQLSVNDLLVLYRAIHAATYQPDARLLKSLQDLPRDKASRQAAQAALEAIDASRKINPSILIPIDASQSAPRERLYPLSFEVPLSDLDLLTLHRRAITALEAYRRPAGDPATAYVEFDKLQRAYLATLAAFGAVSAKAKAIAVTGESASVGTIKLLAHMPAAMQRLLDGIPGRFDMLNDLIKGREVISNVGAVAPGSTLTRFMTAKDDNEKKTLAWGVLTDAGGVMRITLRDFRPHVGLLAAAGRKELAARLTQDYLDAYARGLNDFVRDLQRITLTSRETRAPE